MNGLLRILVVASVCVGASLADVAPETLRFYRIGSPPWITALSDFPFSARNDPRKLNELSVYQGRLYLGYGSIEENLGPTEVGYYDPVFHEFVSEFLLGTELIERFKVIDNGLYVPASDPAHFFNQADYAVRTRDGLWKRNDRQGTLHNHDLIAFNGRLLSAGSGGIVVEGGRQGTILTMSSADQGVSWQPLHLSPEFDPSAGRFRAIIPFQGKAFTPGTIHDPNGCNFDCPVAVTGLDVRVGAYTTFANVLCYIELGRSGVEPSLRTFDGSSASFVRNAIDFIVDREHLTILTSDGRLERSQDLNTWKELPIENLPASACSMVSLDNRLYIGTTDGELWGGGMPISNDAPRTRTTHNEAYGQALAVGTSVIATGVPAAGEAPWNHGEVRLNGDQVLTAPNPSSLGYFGAYLAMDERWMAVAESKRDQERVHLFYQESPENDWEWTQSLSGAPISSIVLKGDLLAVGRLAESRNPAADLFNLYQLQDGAWVPLLTVDIRDVRGEIDDYSSFLTDVALTEGTLLVGISGDPGDNQGDGLALIYEKNESKWQRTANLEQVISASGFGSAVAVNDRWIVIGAPRTLERGVQRGRVYVYDRLANTTLSFTLSPPHGKGGHFGTTVVLNGDLLAIGSPGEDWESRTSGAVYVYDLKTLDTPSLLSRLEPLWPSTRGFGNAVAWNHGRLVIGSEQVPGSGDIPQGALTIISPANDGNFNRLADDWEETHFGAVAASPEADPDRDGQTNIEEMLARTDPHDRSDYLRISSVTQTSTEIQLTWTSVPSVSYAVMASPSLTGATWVLARMLTASSTSTSVTLASSPRSQYYRLVALP